ncbi:hypothetical protein AB0K51_24195 [Kitasatospora sp. NPDC049285]|uniref:hypothetical protein n=1 Tax=Kitasatospora sp. NPDC049285 TaxID=3157096 RepID=UPI0034173C2B
MPRAITAPFDVSVDLDLGSFLLRRRSAVAVDPGALRPTADPRNARGLQALDADLAERGYLLGSELRTALARLTPLALADLGTRPDRPRCPGRQAWRSAAVPATMIARPRSKRRS